MVDEVLGIRAIPRAWPGIHEARKSGSREAEYAAVGPREPMHEVQVDRSRRPRAEGRGRPGLDRSR